MTKNYFIPILTKQQDDFPEDIIPILLSYRVRHFKDLIFYRQINHSWKRTCEGSSQWLRLDLSFRPPMNYLLHYHNPILVQRMLNLEETKLAVVEEVQEEDEAEGEEEEHGENEDEDEAEGEEEEHGENEDEDEAEGEEEEHGENEDEDEVEAEEAVNIYGIQKWRAEHCHFISLLQPQTRFPQALEYVIVNDTTALSSSSSSSSSFRSRSRSTATPHEIQAWFIPLYIRYQQYWKFHITWKQNFLRIQSKIEEIPWFYYFASFLFPIAMVILAILRFEGSSEEWWLGFVYLDCVAVFYGIFLIISIGTEVIVQYFYSHRLDFNSTIWDMHEVSFSSTILYFYLCSYLVILLIRWKLLSGGESGESIISHWSYVSLPLWILPILYFQDSKRPHLIRDVDPRMILSYLQFALPILVTCTMATMDLKEKTELEQKIILLLILSVVSPMWLFFTIYGTLIFMSYIYDWETYYERISNQSWSSFIWTIFPIFVKLLTFCFHVIFLAVMVSCFRDFLFSENDGTGPYLHLRWPNKLLLLLNNLQVCYWWSEMGMDIDRRVYYNKLHEKIT